MNRNILNLATVMCILVTMDYRFTTNILHEMFGLLVVFLFILHNLLNRHWYLTINKRKGTLHHRVRKAINLLLLTIMLVSAVTGIFISKTLFSIISVSGNLWIHQLHTLSSYFCFILCGIHLGIHWSYICNKLFKWLEISCTNLSFALSSRIASALIVSYGIHASFSRQIGSKLLLKHTYTSWGSKPLLSDFLLDHLAIMGCYVVITHYLIRMVPKRISEKVQDTYLKDESIL